MSQCKGCGKTIVWGMTDRGAKVPLDVSAPIFLFMGDQKNGYEQIVNLGKAHVMVQDGTKFRFAVSHFATCPKANEFSASKKQETLK